MKMQTTIESFERQAKEILVDNKNFDGWKDIFIGDAMFLNKIEEDDKAEIQSSVANILLDLIGICKSSGISFLAAAEEALEEEIEDEEN